MSSSDFQWLTYGAKVHAHTVTQLLRHAFEVMNSLSGEERPTPICIWGLHGIGKTELVRGLAKELNAQMVYVAPAQFEEMGDLVGMPRIEGNSTRFAPPSWVPRTEGPGILLLDDVNRADDRILRGIMQLLQYYELVSWQLPKKWLIVLTANPDGGDYSVTPMDDALLNRMLHVTMQFDATEWAKWAEKAGVDDRGINFVLAYPELVNGKRTTPRSLVQFFDQLRPFDNLSEALPMVKLLGEASLDPETVQAFIQFVHLRLDILPSPEEILDSPDFDQLAARLQRIIQGEGVQRLDMLSVVITRLIHFLTHQPPELQEQRLAQLARFILLDYIPNDLRLSMAQALTSSGQPALLKLYAIPEIGQLLLKKM